MKIEQELIKLRDRLGIKENENTAKQIMILDEILDQYYFTENQFKNACKKIVEGKSKTYGEMPIFGEFKELMENKFSKLRTKEESKKDFYLDREKWVNKNLSQFILMVADDKEGRPVFENFITNHFNDLFKGWLIDDFKATFLKDEDLTVDNVKKKIVSIVNTYNQNQTTAVKRMRELFIEKEQERVDILNIKPMLEPSQEKLAIMLNGNIK